jgi:uncharacterized membrane protein
LQFAQAILIALTAVPLAAIVRSYTDDAWGWRAGALALLYPPLSAAAFLEFHELAFFPVLALALLWAADRARWGWYTLFALAAVCVREDATLDLIVAGVVLGIIGLVRRAPNARRGLLAGEPLEPQRLAIAGFALSLLSLSVLAFYWLVVTPQLGSWTPSQFYDYPFAHGPLHVALAIFTHPLDLLRATLTFGRLTYLLEAFVPLALLPLFTRWTWLAVPALAELLLSSVEMAHRMGYEYELLWVPWLLLGAAWSLVQMRSARGENVARRWWIAAVTICVIVLIAFNPMHPAHYLRKEGYQDNASVVRAFACVPPGAPVAAHDQWFAHMALAYPEATEIARDITAFDGYVVYTPDWKNALVDATALPRLEAARESGSFRVVCHVGDVFVVRR